MTPLYIFLWLLFVHFIGDFVLQSHYMSVNKSKDWGVLAVHVGIYSVTLAVGTCALIFLPVTIALGAAGILGFAVVNGVLHFITDAITSRINARLWKAERVHDFFVGVGADQFAHALALGVSLSFLIQA